MFQVLFSLICLCCLKVTVSQRRPCFAGCSCLITMKITRCQSDQQLHGYSKELEKGSFKKYHLYLKIAYSDTYNKFFGSVTVTGQRITNNKTHNTEYRAKTTNGEEILELVKSVLGIITALFGLFGFSKIYKSRNDIINTTIALVNRVRHRTAVERTVEDEVTGIPMQDITTPRATSTPTGETGYASY